MRKLNFGTPRNFVCPCANSNFRRFKCEKEMQTDYKRLILYFRFHLQLPFIYDMFHAFDHTLVC